MRAERIHSHIYMRRAVLRQYYVCLFNLDPSYPEYTLQQRRTVMPRPYFLVSLCKALVYDHVVRP